jgi:Family of unknown function (DUF6445)
MMGSGTGLFALSEDIDLRIELLGGAIPVLIADNVYAHPEAIREAALGLGFAEPDNPYPGRIAPPGGDPSLAAAIGWALRTVNRLYLPRISPVFQDGAPVSEFGKIETDFAIVDTHPKDLKPWQRIPHLDPVPVFGLVYLNREDRGGTLFFEQAAPLTEKLPESRYISGDTEHFKLRGRIEGRFNRLAVYPGSVPHSGEIVGSWIEGEQRFASPRLTQRLLFSR